MPVSKKRKKKTKKKSNVNNKLKNNVNYLNMALIDDDSDYMLDIDCDINEDIDKEIERVPSRKGYSIVFKNTTTAHLEIVEGDEVEPGTLMKDSGFPNAKYFPEGAVIIKDMTPNCYDYAAKYGFDLCYNGGRILDNLSRMYDDEVDKVYAVYSPCEEEPPYKVFADIYVAGYDYHELCTIAQFWKKETLMKWLKTPVGATDIMECILELGRKTEPIDEDNNSPLLRPEAKRGHRRIREMFEEKYPNHEEYSDDEINALYEEFKFDIYFRKIRQTIEFNEKNEMLREFRVRDRFDF